MAINFPNAPANNDTYTENGIKWKYNSAYNAWFVVDDNKILANTSNNQIVYNYNDKLFSSNGIVYSSASNTVYTNAVFVKTINVEASIASSFDKANSANVLAFNTGTGANAFTSATIAGANSAVGAGANAYAASISNTIAILAFNQANAAFEQANTGGGGGGTLTTFTSNVGDGSANTFNVSHELNSFWLLTSVRKLSTGDIVYPDMRQTTANNLVITFVDNPTANQYALLVAKVA